MGRLFLIDEVTDMELKQIKEDIKEYIEEAKEATVFEIMAKKGYSYTDVIKVLKLCVDEETLHKEGDRYVAVQKDKVVSSREQAEQKIKFIMDSLTPKEIDFLKEATDGKTISEFEKYCNERKKKFLPFVGRFLDIKLFEIREGEYRLTLNEFEYLRWWEMIENYNSQKKKETVKKTSVTNLHHLLPNLYKDDDESAKESNDAKNSKNKKETDGSNEKKEIRWHNENVDVIQEIREHISANRNHSRTEIIEDIKETLTNKMATQPNGPYKEHLEKAIVNLVMISDEYFESFKKNSCN